MKTRIIITTYPFSAHEKFDLENVELYMKKRNLTREEHLNLLREKNPHIIIAGTEKYDAEALDCCPALKHIARVGIGLDSIDQKELEKRNVTLSNTPDGPTNAVAELTICQILSLLRKTRESDVHNGWNRIIGVELKNMTVGIVGYGRIGKRVFSLISKMCDKVYVNDIDEEALAGMSSEYVKSKQFIYENCDIITCHVPLTDQTEHMIDKSHMSFMKPEVILVNMSRGGIIKEDDLYKLLKCNPRASAAIDTFEKEPYDGPLISLSNALLSPHLGSCSISSRYEMENGAMKSAMEECERLQKKLDIFDVLNPIIDELDHKHRQQRKIQFLLDIRGYMVINNVVGDYIEFGVYRGEMLYSAWKILGHLKLIDDFIGIDTFCGEPEYADGDEITSIAHAKGAYNCSYEEVISSLSKKIKNLVIHKSDIRDMDDKLSPNTAAICVIDANLPSSNEAAFIIAEKCLKKGGILFVDDYFDNMMSEGFHMQKLIRDSLRDFTEFQTYPPFARAFIAGNIV